MIINVTNIIDSATIQQRQLRGQLLGYKPKS